MITRTTSPRALPGLIFETEASGTREGYAESSARTTNSWTTDRPAIAAASSDRSCRSLAKRGAAIESLASTEPRKKMDQKSEAKGALYEYLCLSAFGEVLFDPGPTGEIGDDAGDADMTNPEVVG